MIAFRWTAVIAAAVLIAGCSGSSGSDANNSAAQSQESRQPLQPQDITDANVALDEGTRLFDNGDTDKAIELFNRAVDLDPDLAEAYFKLGVAYALVEARDADIVETQVEPTPTPEKGKENKKKTRSEDAFEKAVAAYKKHLDANPEDDVAYFNLGRAYNKLNEDEDAAKALKQAVKLKPDDTEYQTELGAILVKLAQYHEAIAPLKKAVDLDPENTRAIGLLEDAEAGRMRVDYATEKKDPKASNSNTSSNSNSASGANSNAEVKPKPNETKEVKPPPPPANRPD